MHVLFVCSSDNVHATCGLPYRNYSIYAFASYFNDHHQVRLITRGANLQFTHLVLLHAFDATTLHHQEVVIYMLDCSALLQDKRKLQRLGKCLELPFHFAVCSCIVVPCLRS